MFIMFTGQSRGPEVGRVDKGEAAGRAKSIRIFFTQKRRQGVVPRDSRIGNVLRGPQVSSSAQQSRSTVGSR